MNHLKLLRNVLYVACVGIGYLLLITALSRNSRTISVSNKNISKAKTILLWENCFTENCDPTVIQNYSKLYFHMLNCTVTNCIMTSNKNFLKSIDLYDAIVFDDSDYTKERLSERSPEQYYIFLTREAPTHTHLFVAFDNFYNLTMTYLIDADVNWYYGVIRNIVTREVIAPSRNPLWMKPNFNNINEFYKSYVGNRNKSRKAAWFVSHCQTASKREDFVKELRKYMIVDIYGGCSTELQCSDFIYCNHLLDEHYKFYLAFENSLCKDYVSEKLFNSLQRKLIPVVFGGANYSQFAPPHSYINARGFSTPEKLARYLLYLDKNEFEYQKYFWWKQWYEIDSRLPFCQLCEILNQPKRLHKRISNIKEYWREDRFCEQSNYILNRPLYLNKSSIP